MVIVKLLVVLPLVAAQVALQVDSIITSSSVRKTGSPPCDALLTAKAALSQSSASKTTDKAIQKVRNGYRKARVPGYSILVPSSNEYEPLVQTWWANNARLRPWCIVLPHDTEDVSIILNTLSKTNAWDVAIRSGGHSVAGNNNVANGVTIDLSMMNSSTYIPQTSIAQIQPGARWKNVYASLQKQGVVVTGGRDGSVGVGGFLLGGGITYFQGTKGFACDSIVNYEVVLSNGTVIEANSEKNRDLFVALKGGSSNFGVVTRFDMEALQTRDLVYNVRFLSKNFTKEVSESVIGYANANEELGENALVSFWSHNSTVASDTFIGTITVNTAGHSNISTDFDSVKKLPTLLNRSVVANMAQLTQSGGVPAGDYVVTSTITFHADLKVINYAHSLHEELVTYLASLMPADHFTTMMFFQPLPSYVGNLGVRKSGNVLGLDKLEHNSVLWTGGVQVSEGGAVFAKAKEALLTMSERIEAFAKKLGKAVDFVYLNYADASQNPLRSYGEENMMFLKQVAQQYDPTGFFQESVVGPFKVARR